MKAFKHMTAFVLALVMAAALAVTAYAASVTVKYRVYVYSDEITFRQHDYSQSTTPSITNLTISATSGLGSGSALYHMKYADGAVAYCIEPGAHSDDSGTYKEGSSASWYNLPASVQSGIALAMSLGYPSADYGAASGDRNSSAIINAEKWAATQAIIWELICEYRNAYTYDDWGYSPFYGCVDTSRYPTFELWYDKIAAAMQNATMIPSFAEYAPRWCDTIELRRNAAGSYTATVTDDNAVLGDYNFAANSGSGITFTRKDNTLTITATAAAAKNLDTEKTYSATGSAYEIDPDRAVICWYDRTGRYQAMAGYTGVGRDPVKAYIKIKAMEEKGSITVRKVDATGAPLAGAELMLETSADGKTWTEVGRVTTDNTGIAKWENLIPQCADGEEQTTREGLVAEILSYQCSDGGWALMGDESDVDMTAMALTSLAPYQEETDVKAAVDAALTYLSDAQQADGGFMSWGAANSESCAQVIVALTALGIDPAADSRFVKNGASPLDGLCAFACEGGGFRHSDEQMESDGMATEQGFYALAAYDRFRQGQTRLFDMTDIEVK